MSIAEMSLRRPVATTMLWLAVVVAGLACWTRLPISALPRYETPTIEVEAKLPGASPQNMSMSVATPMEKEFSSIPGLVGTTSESVQGETKVQLEFDSSRDIDAAAADVQAALFRINRSLPSELPNPPTYKKINPGDAPVLAVALSSPTMTLAELNAYVDELVVPALSTVNGVAQITVKGRKRYAVRVHIDADRLAMMDLTLLEVSQALKAANANSPLGQLDNSRQMLTLQMQGGLRTAADFAAAVVATREGRVVRLSDVAMVVDSVEDAQNTSQVNGKSVIGLDIRRQPGANTVQTVDDVKAMLQKLATQMPGSVRVQLMGDRSVSIRQAIHDVNLTLGLTIALVVLVIFLFLKNAAATSIPAVTVPLSLLGTFCLMQAMGLSLNNISLMGLTIAVGLVVDDAIVVLENIMRHVEEGMEPRQAAARGAREVAFTVLSISVSLVAVFIPIFFMPGTMGLLFHEFAIVVSSAILVSALVSLTLIPVMAPALIGRKSNATDSGPAAGWMRYPDRAMAWLGETYAAALDRALKHRRTVLLTGLATVVATALLYVSAPKGFFPQEDTGQVAVRVRTSQDMSYEGRLLVLEQIQEVLLKDPAVLALASKVDHDSTKFDMDLKDRSQREPMAVVLARMRNATRFVPGVNVSFSPVQNLKIGASTSSSTYQYTLQSVGADQLDSWVARLLQELEGSDVFIGLETDVEKNGVQAEIVPDRGRMAALGVDMASLRGSLYAGFGTREVSTVYAPEATYKVIMELGDEQRRDEGDLSRIRVRSATGEMVPLEAVAKVVRTPGATMVAHKAQLPAVTLSFELAESKSLSDAAQAIDAAKQAIGLPVSVFGSFDGQAALYEQSQRTQLWLVVVAIAVIYLILGVLYESWIHPVTILLGIPSAAVGAFLALRLTGLDLTFIAMIGMLLLIGIVKKNAIMMIDFALDAQRQGGADPLQAIRNACLVRFRPIMMTTVCALVGALPLALGLGAGAELRQPLGVVIVGGLLFSQLITLFITPVVFLEFDRIASRFRSAVSRRAAASASTAA